MTIYTCYLSQQAVQVVFPGEYWVSYGHHELATRELTAFSVRLFFGVLFSKARSSIGARLIAEMTS